MPGHVRWHLSRAAKAILDLGSDRKKLWLSLPDECAMLCRRG